MSAPTGFNLSVAKRLKQIWQWISSPFAKRLQAVMTCGLTPQKLALTFCLGAALGVMPLLWGTTLICLILAHIFRLNHIALQSVNYLLYPVQLALLVPFFKLGDRLLRWGPPVQPDMFGAILRDPLSSFSILGWITLKSLTAWLLTVLPATLLIYCILGIALSRKHGRIS